MKMQAMAAVCLAAGLLAGCNQLGRASRVNPSTIAVYPYASEDQIDCPLTRGLNYDRKTAIDLSCFRLHEDDPLTAYEMATGGARPPSADDQALGNQNATGNAMTRLTVNAESARVARNRFESVLTLQADLVCEREKGLIYSSRAATDTFFDFFSSGLSGASTIVGGDQAKSILSGLAGLSTGTRGNVNANIYQNQLAAAITKVIDGERHRILQLIAAKRSEGISNYPADEMIRLVNKYHQACSFQKGIQLLLDAAVNKEGIDAILFRNNLEGRIAFLNTKIAELNSQLNLAEKETKTKLTGELDTYIDAREKLILQRATLSVPGGTGS